MKRKNHSRHQVKVKVRNRAEDPVLLEVIEQD